MTKFVVISFVLLTFSICYGFYLPGLAPVTFCEKGKETDRCKSHISVLVNRLTSNVFIIPFDYEYFDFCLPDPGAASPSAENLGQIVFGERIHSSPYKFVFDPHHKNPQNCQLVCEKKYKKSVDSDHKKLSILKRGIRYDYQNHFIVDNMPVTWCQAIDSKHTFCTNGFPVGCFVNKHGKARNSCSMDLAASSLTKPGGFYLYNHLDFVVTYNSGENQEWGYKIGESGGRIIRVDVVPRSIRHPASGFDCGDGRPPMQLSSEKRPRVDTLIKYTYSVTFRENNDIKWSSRWDYLLDSFPSAKIQWFSILNSLVIVVFLSGMVAMILMRTVYKDISRYNQLESMDVTQEEFGWKLVHGDVFRPPARPLLLAVAVGSGLQMITMLLATLVFACLGFLSPANRGSLMTCALLLYACLGTPTGYVSARLYKSFRGERRGYNVLATALLCPGIVFTVTMLLNLVMWYLRSSAAMPFLTILALFSIWLFVSLPLTFVGAYFGYRKRPIEHPVRINRIPRQIPDQHLYTRPLPSVLMGGILPFGCIFVQLFFILNSIWANQIYYMFGLLFLVANILAVTCAETTVLLCYFQLCAEDYHWWWRSFLTSGSTALYLFIYCCHYFATNIGMAEPISALVYFGYTAIIVFLFFLITGTFGFLACFWFIRKIYSVVKVD